MEKSILFKCHWSIKLPHGPKHLVPLPGKKELSCLKGVASSARVWVPSRLAAVGLLEALQRALGLWLVASWLAGWLAGRQAGRQQPAQMQQCQLKLIGCKRQTAWLEWLGKAG